MTATTSTRADRRRRPPRPSRTAGPARRPSSDLRRTLLALLASALGAFPLCEMFTDTGWLVDVWLTMVVVDRPGGAAARTGARQSPARSGSAWCCCCPG